MTALHKFLPISLLLCACVLPLSALAVVTRVIYPLGEVQNDTRYKDVIEMLCTSLEKTKAQFGDYECKPSAAIMPKKRFLQELEQINHDINVIWNPTSEELEQRFSAIHISLRKDLLGYRVALIHKDNQHKIDQIKTLNDLKTISFGQGVEWSDNAIYEFHGIQVVQAQYSQLFKMLDANRFLFFPRGVGEILSEYDNNIKGNPNLAIEKNLLIYYPFPYYFFFNRNDKAIKDRVEIGLRLMQKDGSFDAIFNKYHQVAIEKLNLKNRRIIRLENPFLPKNTPMDAATLWSPSIK